MGEYPTDWKVVKLGDIGDFKNGISKSGDCFGHGVPFVNLLDVFGRSSILGRPRLGLIEVTIAEQNVYNLREGDILFVRSSVKPSGVGRTTVLMNDLPNTVYSGFLLRFRTKSIDKGYAAFCFDESAFRKRVMSASTVSANTNINQQRLKGIDLLLPPLPEQRRIAAALGDMDKLIDNLSKRIEKKKAIKQSAMQELLTGKKRLPGFCGEWKKKTLGSSATVKARIGWQGLTTAEYLKDGDHFLVNGVNIENGHVNWQTCFMVDEKRYAQDKNIQLQDFDVLVSKDGTIGKVAYVENMPRTATLNSGVFVIRSVDAELSQEYLARVFLSMWFDDFIEKITAGSTIVHLYQKDIVKFAFEIPPSFAEQQAIAKVLSGMDAEIANLERKLEKLKFMKQGMMQDLLTGKVRLK